MGMTSRLHKLTVCAVSLSLALVLSYLEHLLPLPLPVPGIKLGLANLAVLFLYYRMGLGTAATVSALRVCLANLLFGSAVSFLYGLAGATLSLVAMWALRKIPGLSPAGISVGGGVAHNVAQILLASILLGQRAVMGYLPVLILTGLGAGVAVGLVAAYLIHRIPAKLLPETPSK